MYLSLNQIKDHLRIDRDFHGINGNENDLYLLDLATVAETTIERYIDHPLNHFVDQEGLLAAPLLHACLLYIGSLYNQRESTIAGSQVYEVPQSLMFLLQPYKDYYTPPINS